MSWSNVLGAVVQLGGQFASNASNARQNRKNRNFQMDENEKNRGFAKEMQDRTNMYNSPKEQMDRLRAAGINPHMAFEGGSGMNSSNVSQSVAPTGVAPLPQGRASQWDTSGMADVALKMAQKENIEADTANKKSDNIRIENVAQMSSNDLENQVTRINQENALRSYTLIEKQAGVRLTEENVNKTTQEIINLATKNEEIKQSIENLVSQKSYTEQQTVNLVASLSTIYATAKELNSRADKNKADANLSNEKAKSEKSYRSNIEADTLHKTEMLKSLQRANKIGEKYDSLNAESSRQITSQDVKQAILATKGTEVGMQMQQLKLTEQEIINMTRKIDGASKVVDVINPFNKGYQSDTETTTSGGESSTYRYDREGNYQGHNSTRTTPRTTNTRRSR